MKKRFIPIILVLLCFLMFGCMKQPEEYCAEDNRVYSCGEYTKVVDSDGPTKFYKKMGDPIECPRVSTNELAGECKELILNLKCKTVC